MRSIPAHLVGGPSAIDAFPVRFRVHVNGFVENATP
jgi:hypothetical protein